MEKKTDFKKWSIILGVIFLLILLAVFILIPCPTSSQKFFFRVLLALAAAAFAATVPGSFKFDNKIVSASGAIAVFAIVFLLNPPGWQDSDCDLRNMKATVFIDRKPTQDVQIIIPDIGQKFLTDEFGNANIEFSNSQIKYPSNVIFRFKNEVDSTFVINRFEKKMTFNLISNRKIKSDFSGNNMNFEYNDININLSLTDLAQKSNEALDDPSIIQDDFDFVNYHFRQNKDTIEIYPSSKLVDEIRKKQIITGKHAYEGFIDYFNVYFPQFDIKITNNSDDAIFFDRIALKIVESVPNNAPVIIPGIQDKFTLNNVGFGAAKNLKIKFSTVPNGQKPDWNLPFESTVNVAELQPGGRIDLDQKFRNNVILKNIDSRYFEENQEEYSKFYNSKNLLQTARLKNKDFVDKGANVFGTVTYLDDKNKSQEIRFSTPIDIYREGYGAGFEFSANYNAELRSQGKNYALDIPISNALKPKDFDRISLLLGAKQSGTHTFKIVFSYHNKTIELPYVFKLDLFNIYGNRENMKKIKL
ncbi:hypothetical protein [Chryseobacterium sp. Leaf394]|uniref:hypothetical protein n=1 Tax=Chryseobacterium sp. Leaf394 TaxID=1736361 RepID=UPI0006FF7413|nr:hypothetical protein [Chryseobacterium sp. Leaf394]KQS92851.1 hypothetical protein ASG21_10565 [Chryseobacterium sp. Leaf394]